MTWWPKQIPNSAYLTQWHPVLGLLGAGLLGLLDLHVLIVPRCPSRLTTLQVGFGGMCVYII
jgi:hypothetical protein